MPTTARVRLLPPQVPKTRLPAVLTVAGSDSSGGAGIEADLKTLTAHKVYGLTCITALTAQNTKGVSAVVNTPKEHLRKTLDKDLEDFAEGYAGKIPLKVVKTGMLTMEAVEVLAERVPFLKEEGIALVIDPVMVATSGSSLTSGDVMKLCLTDIIPNSYLVTPNFVEALHLRDQLQPEPEIELVEQLEAFVVALQKHLGCENLLVKGGHLSWQNGKPCRDSTNGQCQIIDVLYEGKLDRLTTFVSDYIETNNSHGSGCTLASSIAANTAKGYPLRQAVPLSIHYIHEGMSSVLGKLGHGNGSLNHTVTPADSVRGIMGGPVGLSLIEKHGSLFQYLKTHPHIKDNWRRYTEHDFVAQVARNQLPFNDFLYFLKQDFYYLVNYAKIHGLAAAASPNCEEIEAQAKIINNIMTEIEKHKLKLLNVYDIDYDSADLDVELQPGPACIAYCDYLLAVGRREDFLGIKVALAPCLHGYAEAGVFGEKIRAAHDGSLGVLSSREQSNTYTSWLEDYVAGWYREAHEEGIRTLDSIFATVQVLEQRMEELCTLFDDVTKLEIAFWDEVCNRK